MAVGSTSNAVWILFLNPNGTVNHHQKIASSLGGFIGSTGGGFGYSVASPGDLDGDSVQDLAVGSGSILWILFLNNSGTVRSQQQITNNVGGFTGNLDGSALASLGDFDGDGIPDLAVGARHDGDGGFMRGAIWIMLMLTDGTVKSFQKISDTQGGFTGTLANTDRFGSAIAPLGDLDGDGTMDLAVGAFGDSSGGTWETGAMWVLFMNENGTVKTHQKISATQGGFTGTITGTWFGVSAGVVGDLDGNGANDLAVGAIHDADGGGKCGAVWIVFLNQNGTVKAHEKISPATAAFNNTLNGGDELGWSVSSLGDLDGDGTMELAGGAATDGNGAVWVLDIPISTPSPSLNTDSIWNTTLTAASPLPALSTNGSGTSLILQAIGPASLFASNATGGGDIKPDFRLTIGPFHCIDPQISFSNPARPHLAEDEQFNLTCPQLPAGAGGPHPVQFRWPNGYVQANLQLGNPLLASF